MTDRPNHVDAHQFLMGRINYERTARTPRKICLARMQDLARRIGNPQNELCIVHVAGSKGKGSTSRMIAEILQANGLRVGVYSSPHLHSVEERISVDGTNCDPKRFAAHIERLKPTIQEMDREADQTGARGPTFFEILTSVAWLEFLDRKVDAAVMEVGLGGRLDSTNVCKPAVCVITNIGLDHMTQLGDTHALIAAEKAGIIKYGVPVVSGVIHPDADHVIQNVAGQRDAELVRIGRDFECVSVAESAVVRKGDQLLGASINYHDVFGNRLDAVDVRMLGTHQAANAAVAIATVAMLDRQRNETDGIRPNLWRENAIRHGLNKAQLPARLEVIRPANHDGDDRPLLVVDGGHNESAMSALVTTLGALGDVSPFARKRVIFAASRDKDVHSMLRVVMAWADEVVLTEFMENPRSCAVETLVEIAGELDVDAEISGEPNPQEAWRSQWRSAGKEDLICVTGSMFLAAELRLPMLAAADAACVGRL